MSIAASVVLYNSDESVIDNVSTYIDQVDKLYIIDNSESINSKLVECLNVNQKIEYVWLKGNLGIATALNVACEKAIADGHDYILMMDDDSRAVSTMVEQMLNYEREYADLKIGIIAAQSDPNLFSEKIRSVWYTITSGSLMKLSAYEECGGFLDKLFIDAVDHEYCFRLKEKGYHIINLDYLHLEHSIGELKELKLFNKTLYKWSSHNHIRMYYMMRNFLYVLTKYHSTIPVKTKILLYYSVSRACFFDSMLEGDILRRIKFLVKAFKDYRAGNFGKISL
ncbi:glycosyltransferase [Spirosoma sp. KUDC1026]|uniref:glycosyltransferase n=1 Tax=Spirosoma sp. KUDC1026 TaxID=2745947 RepID=UPI00159B94EC|nr:glycosyltransferase [Spirosoma sp. KUDC1026]QKZ11936.1 glycosyltransferase [Spirosoma sp. KUDC1026]